MQTDSDEKEYFGESWTVKTKGREAGLKNSYTVFICVKFCLLNIEKSLHEN